MMGTFFAYTYQGTHTHIQYIEKFHNMYAIHLGQSEGKKTKKGRQKNGGRQEEGGREERGGREEKRGRKKEEGK